MRQTIPELDALAIIMVGDGGSPDVFFVSEESAIFLVTTDFDDAYEKWRSLAEQRPLRECALENRQWGVVCWVGRDAERGTRLYVFDDRRLFLQLRDKREQEVTA